MKIKNLKLFALTVSVLFTAGCSSNEPMDEQPVAARFSAGIKQALPLQASHTKVSGNTWEAGDVIGIFMVERGTIQIAQQTANKQHTATAGTTANFTPATGHEIYYPLNGSSVNFIAYYPYASTVSGLGTLSVDVSGSQTAARQAQIDMLWAKADNNGNGYNKESHENTAVSLTFEHKLAKLTLNCTADPSVGVSLEGMDVRIDGMKTTTTMDLSDGTVGAASSVATIDPRMVVEGQKYEAVIVPSAYGTDELEVIFTLGERQEEFIWTPDATTFESGKEYKYQVILSRTGVTATGTIKPWTTVDRGEVTAD